MSHQASEGQQAFTQGDPQHRGFNGSSPNGVQMKQSNNLIVNSSVGLPQSNIIQNSAVALGIVPQQQQMAMLWKGPTPIVPNPASVSATNTQNQNQLTGQFTAIVPSNGLIPINTQVEPSPPIAPGSARNGIIAPEQINSLDTSRPNGSNVSAASKPKLPKATKGAKSGSKGQSKDNDDINGKTEKNRERNREHARSTRLRKKAYIQKLKDMAHGLRAVQTKEIRERRLSMQNMMNVQKIRRAVVQTVFDYHTSNEREPAKWNVLLESSFWMKSPLTPFRSFRRSEIDRDCRIVRGTDAMIADAASVFVMVERIGFQNARWHRIKRNDFLDTLDDRDALNQEIGIPQQPESSLSSESSTDSSICHPEKKTPTRKRPSPKHEESQNIPKVSSSSESGKTNEKSALVSSDTKTNTSSSDEADKETQENVNATKAIYRPKKIAKSGNESHHPPILSRAYLNRVNTERISAFYAVNQDDMIVLEDVLMCPYVFRTKNAVLCGALADCVIPGMLRAKFSKNNKLLSMELVFDAMGFMQQLDSANGDESNAQTIPCSLEEALSPSPNEARVITEALPPYQIVHVNEEWTRMTQYSQVDVEGMPVLNVLQGANINAEGIESQKGVTTKPGRHCHSLEEVQIGRPACSTCIHYNRNGKPFVDFMCSYPLTNSSDKITHLLHVNLELPPTVTLVS